MSDGTKKKLTFRQVAKLAQRLGYSNGSRSLVRMKKALPNRGNAWR